MHNPDADPRKRQSRRELVVASLAAVVAIALIVAVVYIAEQLRELDETIAATGSAESAGSLPAAVVAKGRALYVPAYAHIYTGAGEAVALATTLSVHNTDPEHPIDVDRVRYFDGEGRLLRELAGELAEGPVTLAPMQTIAFRIPQQEGEGGSGANFVVEWSATDTINRPIVEAIMIGDGGLSFTSRGLPIDRR
jgi:hypothetical protein